MASTLRAMSETKLLNELSSSLKDKATTATFACGGTIPIAKVKVPGSPLKTGDKRKSEFSSGSDSPSVAKDLPHREEIKPVDIRWDSTGLKAGTKITFPAQTPFDSESFHQLLSDCEPASFGQRGKDVLDETYRKAGKLEKDAFMTDFCPYVTGIIDVIAQVLLPSIAGTPQLRGVRAERYNLNIYSGPSGKFRAHIDTPRSDMQFGSLVVCLPCVHQGGALLVRHKGNTMEFDWSGNESESEPAIKWAAFYSDCEHEILEVKSGHRITITYNLYVTHGAGMLAGRSLPMDPKQLPLYCMVNETLKIPSFMSRGGILGIHLSHFYPFATENAHKDFPYCLKGVDMAVFEAFHALGLQAKLCSVMIPDEEEYYDEEGASNLEFVNDGLHPFRVAEEEYGDSVGPGDEEVLTDHFPHKVYRDIHWLTKMTYEEMAVVFLSNGNVPCLEWRYACAALLVHVPATADREIE